MNLFNKTRVIAVVLMLVAASSWCAEQDNTLLGSWLVQRVGVRDATKLPFQIEWEFTKDQVIVRDVTHSQELSRNTYTVDLSKEPKWITITVVDQATEVRLGVFRIDGNELHLQQAVGGGARPRELTKDGHTIMKRRTKQDD
jgi:uncharacterized protein (TIGR03067 family)